MAVTVAGRLSADMRIHKLPPNLANQIAAGEVVERPASVVKELLENALDAGARRIAISIELGGKKSIRVEDDGEGMLPDDARLSIERHATSKIAVPDDLEAIRTLGFRGEALPSIASVSHFVLRTRARGSRAATEVRVNGGTVASDREVGAPEGTTIEVDDLFYNLPARRKFLKSDTAETTQISRLVTQMALGYPEVGFTLTSGGRRLLECPPATGLRERFFQLFGERPDLIEVRKEAGGLVIHGYVAALGDQGPVQRPAERVRQPAHRQGPHDRARDLRGLQRRDDQGAQSRGAPLSRDSAGSRRRQRSPDEGRGPVPGAVARARGDSPRARGCARSRTRARAAVHAVCAARGRAPPDEHSWRARGRDGRQPLGAGHASARDVRSPLANRPAPPRNCGRRISAR